MTEIYCFVDDFLRNNQQLANWRRNNNHVPVFSDAEVLTIALMQSEFGVESLKKTFALIAENFRREFPHLCGYKQFVRRLHALTVMSQKMFEQTASFYASELFLIDAKPIPVCQAARSDSCEKTEHILGKQVRGGSSATKLHVLATAEFSILWHHFIDRVFSRSWLGLWNTILLKILFFNLFL